MTRHNCFFVPNCSGDYEGSSSGDYNYSYAYEDYSSNAIENGLDRDSDESEVLYVPQMLSEPLQMNVSIGENVELPCFAKVSQELKRKTNTLIEFKLPDELPLPMFIERDDVQQ